MKKLAIVALVVVSACHRKVVVTTAPPQQTPPTSAASTAPGGANAREALTKVLGAAKAQDIQAMANVWGTKDGGAAAIDRRYMSVEEMEKRLIILIRCLRHDSWTQVAETPVVGGDRQITAQLKYKGLTVSRDFTATMGPGGRWYISIIQMEPPSPICSAS